MICHVLKAISTPVNATTSRILEMDFLKKTFKLFRKQSQSINDVIGDDFEPSLILNNTHDSARQTSVPISNLYVKAQLPVSDILDTTKRCTNGRCLLRRYSEIVTTEEVLEYLRTLKLGRFSRNASERQAPNYA